MTRAVIGPHWIKPVVSLERGEFQRVAESFGLRPAEMMQAAERGQLMDWPVSLWGRLENTDSFETASVAAAEAMAVNYRRDTSSLKHAFATGGDLPAPIVWQRQDGSYYLIAGNTRLMLARAMGVRPQVLFFRY